MVQSAYEQIRRRILDNAWPPGQRALEREVADELGMSRTPVREALMRLQNEGLVEVIPRHGVRVLPVFGVDMQEIYQILTALECMAAELLAARKPVRRSSRHSWMPPTRWARRSKPTTSTPGPPPMSAAGGMGWLVTAEQVPSRMAEWVRSVASQQWEFLLLFNASMLLLGIFIEPLPAMLLSAPLFMPLAQSFGIDMVHFGVIMTANLAIALAHPPVGATLFVSAKLANRA